MSQDFKCHSNEEQSISLAQYLHNGRIFEAKTVVGTIFKKFLLGLSPELKSVEQKIKDISFQYDIFNIKDGGSDKLLAEWESALGIPDDCFLGTATTGTNADDIIVKRRTAVLIKLGVVLLTEQDYIDLGTLLGIEVKIARLPECITFPLPFPLPFCSRGKVANFTMIIQLPKELEECVFPIPFPLCFRFSTKTQIECIFKKLSAANVKLIFEYIL